MSNVVLLMSDEHNPFFSSVYGHPSLKTPTMARLAQIGTTYQNAYCPSPLCLPSRAAFMAGKRVQTLQTYNNCTLGLDPNHLSYGAALAEQGVHSVHIGKTDVYDQGENLGFSEMILPANRTTVHAEVGRNPLMKVKAGAARADHFGPQANPWATDLQRVGAAIDWLQRIAPTIKEPWVLSVNLIKPHFPHYTTPALWDMYPQGADLPAYGPDVGSAQHPYAKDLQEYFATQEFTEAQIRGLRRGYLGCVTFIDQQLGRLLEALEEASLVETTNIIYTSDHGEMLGKFGLWWKCTLYEDSVRVPCLAAGPDFQAGQMVETPVDLFDIQATLFKSVGAERPPDWVGQPLQEIADQADNDDQRVVFSEYHGHGTRASAYMVRKGDWKYIHYVAGPDQLFNLAADPHELHNLIEIETEIETHQDIAADLEKELRAICSPEAENERAEQFIRQQLAMAQEAGYLE